ncbi:hypothetical protein GCM10010458_28540 [Microbacterium luteolum]
MGRSRYERDAAGRRKYGEDVIAWIAVFQRTEGAGTGTTLNQIGVMPDDGELERRERVR